MANELDIASNGSAIATSKPSFSLKSLNLAESCPAVVVASTGSKLSRFPFPKIKFEEGRRCRVAILTEDVIMLKLHYHPEVGYIICDGGACCKYCDKVSIKYCYPCVMYETDNSGRIVSPKIDMKLLVLGGEMYDQISLLSEIGGSITNMDLLFSCSIRNVRLLKRGLLHGYQVKLQLSLSLITWKQMARRSLMRWDEHIRQKNWI